MSCHFLLQGLFPTQASNPHLLHWQADSLPLSHLATHEWLKHHQHPSGGGRNFQHRRSASHTFFGLHDFSSVLSVLKYVFLFFCFFPTEKHWFWPTFHFLLFLYPGLCSQVPFSNTTYRQWPEFPFSVPPDPATHPTCLYIRMLFLPLLFEDPYCSSGCPQWLSGKEPTCNAGDTGSIPGLGRSPGGGHGNPLQYSCLENPHGQRSLVGSTGSQKSRTWPKRLGMQALFIYCLSTRSPHFSRLLIYPRFHVLLVLDQKHKAVLS